MKIKLNIVKLALCVFLFHPLSYATEPLPNNLINFSSQTSLELLKEDLNLNTLKLLSNFTTQQTLSYCGVASSVIILNSIDIPAPLAFPNAPFHYFTQDNFFNDKVNKIIPQAEVLKQGITLTQLAKMLQAYGLDAKPYFANEVNVEKFRTILKDAILNQNFILVNFLRTGLQEKGGGHISPLAAYDKHTDQFLLLDVARYKYPAYWVKTEDLWKGVNTLDDKLYRGFVIIDHP